VVDSADFGRETEVLRALAHPARLAVLSALASGEACVCHLSALFARPQPYVSKQLAELRAAGLVRDRRDGQRVYYRLASPAVATLLAAARDLGGAAAALPEVAAGCPCPKCEGHRGVPSSGASRR
jgi:DNA-binding transcriptional ArsR family regulator